MKVAVSIPDEVFAKADDAAKRLGIARSELYARALAEYLARRNDSATTAALDAVHGPKKAQVDPVLSALQLRSIDWEEW